MTGPRRDRPQARAHADVTLVGRAVTVVARVVDSSDVDLVVRPAGEATSRLAVGDEVQVFWVSEYEERALPARVVAVDGAAETRWRLEVTGAPEASLRRRAVRARMTVPVEIAWDGGNLRGTTVDVSESGMRSLLEPRGQAPGPGTRTELRLGLDEGVLALQGEVVWRDVGGGTWLVAVQFHDVPDDAVERLRLQVFRALREERDLIGG
ncbi:PilZ domain-containing protein [Geodermatophilus sp. YIM 151500]|uniref:PilZ domain-containing protein n=1 Tax=Geodermatophilus sp. YIM 151500 TaxID=2984531 RepID=UPI0021E4773D|nr:PilZ domain-containing protein [Geodermatophilus sp. YIM 151500]MCV2488055.1 PilZ domain-containing protein [Geodermatophilus sp. YIM 151500]